MTLAKFDGVYVANVTPFSASGEVALDRFREHLSFLSANGVHGFVPCGTTGESATLTRGERRKLLEASCDHAKPKGLKVIAGCGGNDTAAVIELVQEAKAIGCDAALVVTPYYNKPTQAGLVAHYRAVADRGGLPLVLYNVPGRTNVHLEMETVARLFEHPHIVGLKEASGRYSHWIALSTKLDLSRKALLSGDDDAMVTLMALGGSGIISAAANVAPKHFVALHWLMRSGSTTWEEAFKLQKKLYPLVRALFLETNPAPAKFALEAMGMGEAGLRLPLVPVSAGTASEVLLAMKELGLLP